MSRFNILPLSFLLLFLHLYKNALGFPVCMNSVYDIADYINFKATKDASQDTCLERIDAGLCTSAEGRQLAQNYCSETLRNLDQKEFPGRILPETHEFCEIVREQYSSLRYLNKDTYQPGLPLSGQLNRADIIADASEMCDLLAKNFNSYYPWFMVKGYASSYIPEEMKDFDLRPYAQLLYDIMVAYDNMVQLKKFPTYTKKVLGSFFEGIIPGPGITNPLIQIDTDKFHQQWIDYFPEFKTNYYNKFLAGGGPVTPGTHFTHFLYFYEHLVDSHTEWNWGYLKGLARIGEVCAPSRMLLTFAEVLDDIGCHRFYSDRVSTTRALCFTDHERKYVAINSLGQNEDSVPMIRNKEVKITNCQNAVSKIDCKISETMFFLPYICPSAFASKCGKFAKVVPPANERQNVPKESLIQWLFESQLNEKYQELNKCLDGCSTCPLKLYKDWSVAKRNTTESDAPADSSDSTSNDPRQKDVRDPDLLELNNFTQGTYDDFFGMKWIWPKTESCEAFLNSGFCKYKYKTKYPLAEHCGAAVFNAKNLAQSVYGNVKSYQVLQCKSILKLLSKLDTVDTSIPLAQQKKYDHSEVRMALSHYVDSASFRFSNLDYLTKMDWPYLENSSPRDITDIIHAFKDLLDGLKSRENDGKSNEFLVRMVKAFRPNAEEFPRIQFMGAFQEAVLLEAIADIDQRLANVIQFMNDNFPNNEKFELKDSMGRILNIFMRFLCSEFNMTNGSCKVGAIKAIVYFFVKSDTAQIVFDHLANYYDEIADCGLVLESRYYNRMLCSNAALENSFFSRKNKPQSFVKVVSKASNDCVGIVELVGCTLSMKELAVPFFCYNEWIKNCSAESLDPVITMPPHEYLAKLGIKPYLSTILQCGRQLDSKCPFVFDQNMNIFNKNALIKENAASHLETISKQLEVAKKEEILAEATLGETKLTGLIHFTDPETFQACQLQKHAPEFLRRSLLKVELAKDLCEDFIALGICKTHPFIIEKYCLSTLENYKKKMESYGLSSKLVDPQARLCYKTAAILFGANMLEKRGLFSIATSKSELAVYNGLKTSFFLSEPALTAHVPENQKTPEDPSSGGNAKVSNSPQNVGSKILIQIRTEYRQLPRAFYDYIKELKAFSNVLQEQKNITVVNSPTKILESIFSSLFKGIFFEPNDQSDSSHVGQVFSFSVQNYTQDFVEHYDEVMDKIEKELGKKSTPEELFLTTISNLLCIKPEYITCKNDDLYRVLKIMHTGSNIRSFLNTIKNMWAQPACQELATVDSAMKTSCLSVEKTEAASEDVKDHLVKLLENLQTRKWNCKDLYELLGCQLTERTLTLAYFCPLTYRSQCAGKKEQKSTFLIDNEIAYHMAFYKKAIDECHTPKCSSCLLIPRLESYTVSATAETFLESNELLEENVVREPQETPENPVSQISKDALEEILQKVNSPLMTSQAWSASIFSSLSLVFLSFGMIFGERY